MTQQPRVEGEIRWVHIVLGLLLALIMTYFFNKGISKEPPPFAGQAGFAEQAETIRLYPYEFAGAKLATWTTHAEGETLTYELYQDVDDDFYCHSITLVDSKRSYVTKKLTRYREETLLDCFRNNDTLRGLVSQLPPPVVTHLSKHP